MFSCNKIGKGRKVFETETIFMHCAGSLGSWNAMVCLYAKALKLHKSYFFFQSTRYGRKSVSAWKYIIQKGKEQNFELSQIGNMDETSMCFHLSGNRTVNVKGEKYILTVTTAHKNTNFIVVVLSCLADRKKLTPITIIKCKNHAKEHITYIRCSHLCSWKGLDEWIGPT